MRLGATILENFCDYNDFEPGMYHEYNIGSASRVYMQLVDLNKKLCSDVDGTCYLRYIPAPPASMQVTLSNIDSAKSITRTATQDTTDPSIWYFDILASDTIGSGNLHLSLTENGVTTKGVVMDAVKGYPVDPGNISFC